MAMNSQSADTQWSPYVVVVGIDFSPASGYAVREGLRLAREHDESELHVVHVVEAEPRHVNRGTRIERLNTTLEEVPDEVRRYVGEQGHLSELELTRLPVGIHVRVGSPRHELLQLTADVGADLLVVGTHGKSKLQQFFVGSVSQSVVQDAYCPVLVARPVDYATSTRSETSSIAPPCPACVEERRASGGERWWCEEHSKPRKTHYYSSTEVVRWAEHDSEVSPTGVDM